jgi:hypothetical protein
MVVGDGCDVRSAKKGTKDVISHASRRLSVSKKHPQSESDMKTTMVGWMGSMGSMHLGDEASSGV